MKITIVGSGYVGMSLAVLLAQHNDVLVLDVDEDFFRNQTTKNFFTLFKKAI